MIKEIKNSGQAALEIERRYLVRMPDLQSLIRRDGAAVTGILQTYLRSETEGEVKRVRQRGQSGVWRFYLTTKRVLSDLVRAEEETEISAAQYIELLMTADTTLHQIRKDRYCFPYGGFLFELDIYPFWDDKAILEVELNDETQEVRLPDFITVLKEVTDDASFSNHSIAKAIPK